MATKMDLSVPLDTVKDEQEQNKNSDLLPIMQYGSTHLLSFLKNSNKVFTNNFSDILIRVASVKQLSYQIRKLRYILQAFW